MVFDTIDTNMLPLFINKNILTSQTSKKPNYHVQTP